MDLVRFMAVHAFVIEDLDAMEEGRTIRQVPAERPNQVRLISGLTGELVIIDHDPLPKLPTSEKVGPALTEAELVRYRRGAGLWCWTDVVGGRVGDFMQSRGGQPRSRTIDGHVAELRAAKARTAVAWRASIKEQLEDGGRAERAAHRQYKALVDARDEVRRIFKAIVNLRITCRPHREPWIRVPGMLPDPDRPCRN